MTTTAATYTCSRCGGSGRYSFNLIHGTRCYGCGGTGKQKTKPAPKMTRWAILGIDRNTGERARLYNVDAKNEAAAIERARNTMARASTAFKDQYSLADAIAVKASELDQVAA